MNLYSYKELKVATDDFSQANKIGEGGFGSVYKVTYIYCTCILGLFTLMEWVVGFCVLLKRLTLSS